MTSLAEQSPHVAVRMRGIVKTFPGVKALDDADFEVRAGEIHGLLGKNGAGKSTLVSILTGMYPPDAGSIEIAGRTYDSLTPDRAKAARVAIVPQHAHLLPSLSIAENVFCGRLPTTRLGFVDWRRVNREAEERLGQLGLDLDLDVRRKVEGLSVAERQMIDIAKALFADASVIVLDEPTAPLPKHEIEQLFGFVRQLRDTGAAFIYISHYLEEVFVLCDRVTVLRDGRIVGTAEAASLDANALVQMISGAAVSRFVRPKRGALPADAPPALEVDGLTREPVYRDVSLTVRAGEVVGLTGLEGSGPAQLARGLFGLEPAGEGALRVNGRSYRARSPREAFAQGLAYLPRDRHGLGIVGVRSVAENITLPILRALRNPLGFQDGRRTRELVERYIEALDIRTPSISQPVEFLSGGNQQKVVAAKLAATRPRVLLLDEPTQGVDVQAKVEILRIVGRMAEEDQVGVVVISDEIGELIDICDRILVMFRGDVVAEFRAGEEETTAHNILLAIEGSRSAS